LTLETYFWPKSAWSWTFYRYSLNLSDFISAILKSIIDLLKKFFVLDHEFCIHNYWLHLTLIKPDSIQTVGHIWHISGLSALDLELSMYTLWLLLIWLYPYRTPYKTYWTYFWQISPRSRTFFTYSLTPSDERSGIKYCIFDPMHIFLGQRLLDLELFLVHIGQKYSWPFITYSLIHSDLAWVIYEPILTYWTNFWQISPWWWTFYIKSLTPSDDMSATENCVFDLMDIFLSNWYSIFTFQYILIDSFWCYFSHVWTHFWPTEQISGKLVFDDEISIQTYWLFLVLHKTDNKSIFNLRNIFLA